VPVLKGIALKNRLHVALGDHEDMLDGLGITEPPPHRDPIFVRMHLTPRDGDPYSNPADWVYEVMQDILPDWYVADYDRQRMLRAAEKWWQAHVFDGVDGVEIKRDGRYLIRNCRGVRLTGACEVYELSRSHVAAMTGGATVLSASACDIDFLSDYAVIVILRDGSCVAHLGEFASIKTMEDTARVVLADGNAVIHKMTDQALIDTLAGNAKVRAMYCTATIASMAQQAEIGDMWENSVVGTLADNAVIHFARGESSVATILGQGTVQAASPRVRCGSR